MSHRASEKAVLVVDMIRDYVTPGAPMEIKGARTLIPGIRERVKRARAQKVPVIYLCDRRSPADPLFRGQSGFALWGSKGAEVVSGCAPTSKDVVVPKASLSGFFKTSLEAFLKSRKVKILVVTGVATDGSILSTGLDALMRGYRLDIPSRSVRGRDPHLSSAALEILKKAAREGNV